MDREHLARYAQVCGFRNADVLAPTYLHVLAFPMSMRLMSAGDFPFELLGLVHVANRIEVTRPATADESFDVRVHAADLRPHRSGTQVDLVTEVEVAGERVWTGDEHVPAPSPCRPEPCRPEPCRPEPCRPEPCRPEPRRPEQHGCPPAVGDRTGRRARRHRDLATRRGTRSPITPRSSGDRNPIHLYALSAKAFGFPRAIAHGMWTAAHAIASLEGSLPAAYDYAVEFRKPLLLPGTAELATHRRGTGWELDVRGSMLATLARV